MEPLTLKPDHIWLPELLKVIMEVLSGLYEEADDIRLRVVRWNAELFKVIGPLRNEWETEKAFLVEGISCGLPVNDVISSNTTVYGEKAHAEG